MQVVLGSQEPAGRWGKPSVLLSEKLCCSSWALATSVLQQAVGAALHDLSYNREYLPSLYGGKQMWGQTTRVGNAVEGQTLRVKNKSHQGSARYNSPQKTCVPPRISHYDYHFSLISAALSHFSELYWAAQGRHIWYMRLWEGEGTAGPHRAAPPKHPLPPWRSEHTGALGDSLYSLPFTRAMDSPVSQKMLLLDRETSLLAGAIGAV